MNAQVSHITARINAAANTAKEVATSDKAKHIALQGAKYTGIAVGVGLLYGIAVTVAAKTVDVLY